MNVLAVRSRQARWGHLAAAMLVACVPARPAEEPPDTLLAPGSLARPAPDEAPPAQATPSGRTAPPVQATPPERLPAPRGRAAVLSRTVLIRAVIVRNPGVEERRQALRAARARRSQVTALDDPEIAYSFAPMSIGSSTFGQVVQVSQRFPWPGKLGSLGDAAEFEAEAAGQDVHVTELDLALEASLLFDDYWLVKNERDVNLYHQHLLDALERSAESQLSVGRASLQDPLQAEVELARLAEQDVMLRSTREVVVARLNALLHRAPDAALPPPPRSPDATLDLPPPEAVLLRAALATSPELRALGARGRAAEAKVRHAKREYYPDFTLMASYNTMFMPDSRFMVGASTPIPLQRGRRGGALDEADAEVAGIHSERARVIDRIQTNVVVARQRVVETIRVLQVFDRRLLPVARAQVTAARTEFVSGRAPFVAVVDAERSLRDVELSRWTALAKLGKGRARLDRALGRIPFAGSRSGAR